MPPRRGTLISGLRTIFHPSLERSGIRYLWFKIRRRVVAQGVVGRQEILAWTRLIVGVPAKGLFIGLEGDIDGMVHLSDLDWNRSGEEAMQDYKKGDLVQAVVLDVDVEKERISLGVKQLDDSFSTATEGVRRGAIVTVTVTAIEDGGIEVEHEGMKAFIRRSDLSRERTEQRPDRFAIGDKVDARVTNVDAKSRRLGLSIKALQIAEEREAVEQFGSSDSGASLGDILGAALKERGGDE